ncbi:MAG: 16S rRNA (adenine(1518)-N(6)/adenine(1519)-N(6))-dimethyltransferase RsmA [Chloroflexi bacterium]|nr:16S rRNA (adenine(1518)-N(6)/adenine(1519)-N(6))-dimethyltransferase RsmA [Chloroflexota bacterium]
MTNPRILLEHYEIVPKKSLGQNFLHDPNALEKIATIAEIMPQDTVLEIGPGTGALTEVLAQRARHVIAVEVDTRLQPLLEARLGVYDNVVLMFADILETDVLKLVGSKPFSVVANLPYYITSAILRHLLENYRRPQKLVLTVQEEVAQRLVARPDDMSLLTVSVQFYGKARIAMKLNPAVFWPRPDVDSAVVVIETYDRPSINVPSSEAFFKVVRAGFSQKRKQLKNALGSGLGLSHEAAAGLLERAGIDPRRRAETVTLEEWAALTRVVG